MNEYDRITRIVLKHARDAFVDDRSIDAQWRDLNFTGRPDLQRAIAEYDGLVVGSAVGCSVEKSSGHSGLARPDNAGLLAFAAVLPTARGRGIGRALGEAVLQWSTDCGYDSVVTDWRVTNLLSSRTWPRLGFEQTFHRLHRLIAY